MLLGYILVNRGMCYAMNIASLHTCAARVHACYPHPMIARNNMYSTEVDSVRDSYYKYHH